MPGYHKCIGAVTLMVIMLGCCGIAAQSDQPLVNVGNEDDPTIFPLGLCEGECDTDEDCEVS